MMECDGNVDDGGMIPMGIKYFQMILLMVWIMMVEWMWNIKIHKTKWTKK